MLFAKFFITFIPPRARFCRETRFLSFSFMKRVNKEKKVLTFCPTVLQLLYNLAREVLLAFELEKEKKNIQDLIKKVYSEKIGGHTHKPKVFRFQRKPLFAEGAKLHDFFSDERWDWQIFKVTNDYHVWTTVMNNGKKNYILTMITFVVDVSFCGTTGKQKYFSPLQLSQFE